MRGGASADVFHCYGAYVCVVCAQRIDVCVLVA